MQATRLGCAKEVQAVVEEQDAAHSAALAEEEQRIDEAMAMTRSQQHAFTCWKVNPGGVWDKAWHVDDQYDDLKATPGIYNSDGDLIDTRYSYTLCECMANDSAHPGVANIVQTPTEVKRINGQLQKMIKWKIGILQKVTVQMKIANLYILDYSEIE